MPDTKRLCSPKAIERKKAIQAIEAYLSEPHNRAIVSADNWASVVACASTSATLELEAGLKFKDKAARWKALELALGFLERALRLSDGGGTRKLVSCEQVPKLPIVIDCRCTVLDNGGDVGSDTLRCQRE